MTATFLVDLTASHFINNETPRVLGHLAFTDAVPASGVGWFVTNQPLALRVSNGAPVINVSNVVATLQSALEGTQGMTKRGDGTLVLAGSNSYTGVTTINGGAVRIAESSALGSTAAGTTIQNPETARLEVIGSVTLHEPLTVACKRSALGNPPAVVNLSGTNTLAGQITLTTGGSFWTFEAAGGKLRVTGLTTNSTTTNVRTIWLRGSAEGEWGSAIRDSAGSLATAVRKDDSGTWVLAGDNTATGAITVSNGTLLVNGAVSGPVNVAGGSLGGTGLITAPVTVGSNATLAPGALLGTLTIGDSLTLSAGSVTRMELSALSSSCDRVVGLRNLVYDGTLVLSNVAGSLLAGQSFPLFQATNALGNFASLSPPSPGPGLAWDFDPTNGTLSVCSLAPPQFTSIAPGAGGSFTLSGTGPAGAGYRIFATSELSLPFSNWTVVATGIFSGGAFSFTNTQATNFPQQFYRAVTP
jgi:autotransporter-associated beta strand protein